MPVAHPRAGLRFIGTKPPRRDALATVQVAILVFMILSQAGLAGERQSEYIHSSKQVLGFLDSEFRDRDNGGYYSNPYGKPVKLSSDQTLLVIASLEVYNLTGDKKSLADALSLLDYLSTCQSPDGGCYRAAAQSGPIHIDDQAAMIRCYVQACRNLRQDDFTRQLRRATEFLLDRLCVQEEEGISVRSWFDPANGTWERSRLPSEYFDAAVALLEAYKIDRNETYLRTAKSLLRESESFWDRNNFGYSHSAEDDTRFARDHAKAVLAYLTAFDVTRRKDYLQRASDVMFYMVARMADKVSKTFYEGVSRTGEVLPSGRRYTLDHLMMAHNYFYAYTITLEDKYLRQGRSLLDSILARAYDRSVGSFTDQVRGGVMADLRTQAYGSYVLAEAYRLIRKGPSPVVTVVVLGVLIVLIASVGYLFKRSWPY